MTHYYLLIEEDIRKVFYDIKLSQRLKEDFRIIEKVGEIKYRLSSIKKRFLESNRDFQTRKLLDGFAGVDSLNISLSIHPEKIILTPRRLTNEFLSIDQASQDLSYFLKICYEVRELLVRDQVDTLHMSLSNVFQPFRIRLNTWAIEFDVYNTRDGKIDDQPKRLQRIESVDLMKIKFKEFEEKQILWDSVTASDNCPLAIESISSRLGLLVDRELTDNSIQKILNPSFKSKYFIPIAENINKIAWNIYIYEAKIKNHGYNLGDKILLAK